MNKLDFWQRLHVVGVGAFHLGIIAYLYPALAPDYESVIAPLTIAFIKAIPYTVVAIGAFIAVRWLVRWVLAGRPNSN